MVNGNYVKAREVSGLDPLHHVAVECNFGMCGDSGAELRVIENIVLDGIKEPVTMLSIEGSSYVCFILPGEAVDMCKDIAASGKVSIRFSADATHSGTTEFLLGEEAKALFGAVYEAYMMYDAVLDNDRMDSIIDGEAYEYMTYKREVDAAAPIQE